MATTTRGLYYPDATDPPIGDGDVTAIQTAAEAVDAALSAYAADTGMVTVGVPVTPASGWEVLVAEYRLIGKDMSLHVWVKNTGSAITASAKGNVVGDPLLFTVTDSALRPSLDFVVGQFRASATGGSFKLDAAGGCQIYDMHSSSVIAAPTSETYQTVNLYANYPIP